MLHPAQHRGASRQGVSTEACDAGRGLSAGLQRPIGKHGKPEAEADGLRVLRKGFVIACLSHELMVSVVTRRGLTRASEFVRW